MHKILFLKFISGQVRQIQVIQPCYKLTIENRKLRIGVLVNNIIETKIFDFSVRIVKLYNFLCDQKKEFTLSKQLLRSGTSIGANIAEAQKAQSRSDFVSKVNIALKETSETKYWINLLIANGCLSANESDSILSDCVEIEKILVSIIKTSKNQ